MASAWPIVPVSTEAGIVLANLYALQEQREYRVSVAWLLSLKWQIDHYVGVSNVAEWLVEMGRLLCVCI